MVWILDGSFIEPKNTHKRTHKQIRGLNYWGLTVPGKRTHSTHQTRPLHFARRLHYMCLRVGEKEARKAPPHPQAIMDIRSHTINSCLQGKKKKKKKKPTKQKKSFFSSASIRRSAISPFAVISCGDDQQGLWKQPQGFFFLVLVLRLVWLAFG